MIDPDEAVRLVRAWLGRDDAEVSLHEFDLGYVAWTPQAAGPSGGPPSSPGAARAVVDKETGEVTSWPSLPVAVVAEKYTVQHAAAHRFPVDVRATLDEAGWWPGRDANLAVTDWLLTVAPTLAGLDLSDAAREVLDEFGGLTIPQFGPNGTPDGGFPSHFHPLDEADRPLDTRAVQAFIARSGIPVFPVGVHDDGPADLAVDAWGRMYLLHWTAGYLVGSDLTAALAWLVRGDRELPLVVDADV